MQGCHKTIFLLVTIVLGISCLGNGSAPSTISPPTVTTATPETTQPPAGAVYGGGGQIAKETLPPTETQPPTTPPRHYPETPTPTVQPICKVGEVKTATCPDGVTTYASENCVNGEWITIKYIIDPCAPLPAEEGIQSVEIPVSIENNCMGFLSGSPREIEMIALIGGAWTRPHPGPFAWQWLEPQKGSFDFAITDELVKEAQKNGVAILGTIWPYTDWDQRACHDQKCEVSEEDEFYPRSKFGMIDGIPKSRCAPCSLDDYKNFLSKLVERYDGDGIDDMPGLTLPVKYWEVLNEPEMKELFLTFYKGTQEEYVEILKASHEAIKAACSDCKVVQGGAAGSPDTNSYWARIFDLGGADYFDIANIHFIGHGDLNTLNVRDFKKVMNEKGVDKPIWVTEAEYSSENEVEASVDGALNEGASKIFFTRFIVGQRGPPRPGEYSQVYDKIALKCKG